MTLPLIGGCPAYWDFIARKQAEEEGSYEIITTVNNPPPPQRPRAPELLLRPAAASELAKQVEPLIAAINQTGLSFERTQLLSARSAAHTEIERYNEELRRLGAPTQRQGINLHLYTHWEERDPVKAEVLAQLGTASLPIPDGPEGEAWRFQSGIERQTQLLMRRWGVKVRLKLLNLLLERLDREDRARSPLFSLGLKRLFGDQRLLVFESELLDSISQTPGTKLIKVSWPELALRSLVAAARDEGLAPAFAPDGFKGAYAQMTSQPATLVTPEQAALVPQLLNAHLFHYERLRALNEWYFQSFAPSVFGGFDRWFSDYCRSQATSASGLPDPWHRDDTGRGVCGWLRQIKLASSDYYSMGPSAWESRSNQRQYDNARLSLAFKNVLVLRHAVALTVNDTLGQDDKIIYAGYDVILVSASTKSANRLVENLSARVPNTLKSLFPVMGELNLTANLQIT